MTSLYKARTVIRDYRFVARPETVEPPEPEPAPQAAPRVDLAAVKDEAAELLAAAQAAAERLQADAGREVEALRRRAETVGHQEGFEAGRREGLALMEQALKEEVAYLQQVAASLVAERANMLARAESDLADLAVAIARKLVGDLALAGGEATMQMCRQAVAQLGQTAQLRIHVHPGDVRRLAGFWGHDGLPAAELVPDERVTLGGCIVTSGPSTVDAQLETQLGLVQQAFRSLQGNP